MLKDIIVVASSAVSSFCDLKQSLSEATCNKILRATLSNELDLHAFSFVHIIAF